MSRAQLRPIILFPNIFHFYHRPLSLKILQSLSDKSYLLIYLLLHSTLTADLNVMNLINFYKT